MYIGTNIKHSDIFNNKSLILVNKKVVLISNVLLNKLSKKPFIKICTIGVLVGIFHKLITNKGIYLKKTMYNHISKYSLNKIWIKKSSLFEIFNQDIIRARDISLISLNSPCLNGITIYYDKHIVIALGYYLNTHFLDSNKIIIKIISKI